MNKLKQLLSTALNWAVGIFTVIFSILLLLGTIFVLGYLLIYHFSAVMLFLIFCKLVDISNKLSKTN